MRQELFRPCSSLGDTLESTRNDSSASREHGGDPRGSRCWPRRSLPTHRSTLASRGNGRRASDERRHRGVLGRPPRREHGGLVPSATMKDATHVMAGAVLSEPRTAKDHESFHRATKAGSADGLRKRKNTPLSTLRRSLLQEVVRTTQRDPRIRCSRRTPFVSAWKPWRGARCSVSDQRALHRAPSPCASQRGTPGSGSPESEPLRSSERTGGT